MRMLMIHRGSIDGEQVAPNPLTLLPASQHQQMNLTEWMLETMYPGGKFYDETLIWTADPYAPGTRGLYSNLGMDIAGWIGGLLVGREWSAVVQEVLFAPVGMEAGFDESQYSTSARLNQAHLYIHNISVAEPLIPTLLPNLHFHLFPDVFAGANISHGEVESYFVPAYPASGLGTNAISLAQYLLMCMNSGVSLDPLSGVSTRILKESTFRMMLELQVPDYPVSLGFAHINWTDGAKVHQVLTMQGDFIGSKGLIAFDSIPQSVAIAQGVHFRRRWW